MSGVVLALGALLALAGIYEMVVGSGDILSERGWSAFIAGAVFLAGGASTAALGVAVRAVDRLRVSLAPPHGSVVPADVPRDRLEPAAASLDAAPVVAVPGPTAEPPAVALMIPVSAPAAGDEPSEHVREPHSRAAAEIEPPTPAAAEPAADTEEDWLDRSFADLHREMAIEPPAIHPTAAPRDAAGLPPSHVEPLDDEPLDAEIVPSEPTGPDRHDTPAATTPFEDEPFPHATAALAEPRHEAAAAAPDAAGLATVAAREEPPTPASPVIGRYESEGTSYVMYADGSIDAQSEAGVYRFASMAELKAFIEG